MNMRDPHYVALGPRSRVFDPLSQRTASLRKTDDGRVPGVDPVRGDAIYSAHHSSGELKHLRWYRSTEHHADPTTWPSTWTVSTHILCGAFHYETGAIVDDFGSLVLPEVVREERRIAERRRAMRGSA